MYFCVTVKCASSSLPAHRELEPILNSAFFVGVLLFKLSKIRQSNTTRQCDAHYVETSFGTSLIEFSTTLLHSVIDRHFDEILEIAQKHKKRGERVEMNVHHQKSHINKS